MHIETFTDTRTKPNNGLLKNILNKVAAHCSMSDNKDFDNEYNAAIKEVSILIMANMDTLNTNMDTLTPNNWISFNDKYPLNDENIIVYSLVTDKQYVIQVDSDFAVISLNNCFTHWKLLSLNPVS